MRFAVTIMLFAGTPLFLMSPAAGQNAPSEETIQYSDGRTADEVGISPPPRPPAPGTPTAMIDAALAGDYFLQGEMETASGLRLKADGSFEWFYSVGSLDIIAQGKWSASEETVLLVNDPLDYASNPYRFVGSRNWADATDEEKQIGKGIATPPCQFGSEEYVAGPAKPLDREIIIQLAFSPESRPLSRRTGKPHTTPYPLPGCTRVTVLGSGQSVDRIPFDNGYVIATLDGGSSPQSLLVENPYFTGSNYESFKIDLPPLKPGAHRIWLDYKRFETRLFEELLLAREEDRLRPFFGNSLNTSIYVRSDKENAPDAGAPAEDRAE